MKIIKEGGLTELIKNIKQSLDGKEPNILKKSGFNLTKTDSVENDTNKLFTGKGAFDLKAAITTAYTNLVTSTRTALETSIATKTPHGGYAGSSQQLKNEIDSKMPNPGYGGVHEMGRHLDLHLSESIADYDARVSVNNDKSILIENQNGNLEIGAKNTTHCHIYTDREAFYLNKEILINNNRVYHVGYKPGKADVGLGNVNNWGASSSIGANSTTEYATTNMVAQVRNEKLNNRNRDNWKDGSVIGAVVGQLAWKNYNNGHTIFDASAGTTPTGVAKNNTNPDVEWGPTYPTLMGYNGRDTYGVRVDRARKAEQLIGFDPNSKVNVSGHMLTGELARNISDSWVASRDRAVTRIDCGDSSAASAFRARGSSITFTCGVLGNNNVGFRGYYNSRTTNGCDGQFYMDVAGNCNATGTLRASAVYNAVWNDYAEYFPRYNKCITEAGDIIALNLDEEGEFYELATENHIIIVGAHSDQFGHLIGGENPPDEYQGTFTEYNDPKYIPVGLVGRLPVKFIGEAKKGMKVVPSHIPGVGRAFDRSTDDYDKVIGYIVENNSEDGIRRVKIKIGK